MYICAMIQRMTESVLAEIISNFPVLGIIGPRQSGKTTASKHLMTLLSSTISFLYLDLENPEDAAKISDPVLFFKMNMDKCIILDEIQARPDLFPVIRAMVDMKREAGRFILTGSASPELIRGSSQSLAGRIAYLEITPFNYTEIFQLQGYTHHWLSGGFPDAFLGKSDRTRKLWLQNFIRTYLERDIPALDPGINRRSMSQLLRMSAHVHGNVINYSALARSLGVTSPTIRKYLNFLEHSFLIKLLEPYSVNVKKRLVKSPKLFFRDSGILHSLLGLHLYDDLMSHPQLGNSWEGYVIEQIIQLTSGDFNPCFYRTHEGAECDLVLLKGNKPYIAIEIKYTSAPKISFGTRQAFSDLKAKHQFIITPETDDYFLAKDIRVCNIHDFLLKMLPEILKE